jgi:hypothetical protein
LKILKSSFKGSLLLDFFSMSDGNDDNDKAADIDLVDNPVIADRGAVGIAFFELFTTGRPGILLQLHHFIFDPGSS